MIGAVVGDIIGSYYEAAPTKDFHFDLFPDGSRFTDDTVMTVAVADWIMSGGSLVDWLHEYFHRYPQAGYGMSFTLWAGHRRREPYDSWANGSAMRVSPVGWAFDSFEEVTAKARESAEVTHNHEEGIRGAQATAAAIFLARTGNTKDQIRERISGDFGYDLGRTLADIRPDYSFDVSCRASVPESMIAFLEATDFESAVRNAISLGGDADTMACIAGAIAEAFYGAMPKQLRNRAFEFLDNSLSSVALAFENRFVTR